VDVNALAAKTPTNSHAPNRATLGCEFSIFKSLPSFSSAPLDHRFRAGNGLAGANYTGAKEART
jgi:hypothetical protein